MLQDRVGYWLALAGAGLLLALAGCSGSAQVAPGTIPAAGAVNNAATAAQPQTAPGFTLAVLPRPSSLLKPLPAAANPAQSAKSASYTLNDLGKDGSDIDQSLPRRNFSLSGKEVTLMPSYTGHPLDTSGLSYVTYHFNAPGFDRNPQLRLGWSAPPANAKTVWLGLSRWDKDRWDWYQGSLSGITDLPFIDKYFNFSGDLLLVVLRIGTDWSSHGSVGLGGPTPVAAISADTAQGDVPLSVHLDASASNPVEGTITKYEWDTDGNGIYETDTGTTPTLDTVYSSNGTFHATVRVTSDINAKDDESVDIVAVGPWQHTLGLGSFDAFSCVGADSDGNIYTAGSFTHATGPLNYDIVLAKWNPAGSLLWAKKYDSGEDDFCSDFKFDAAQQIYLVGSQDVSGNRQALVQKWNQGGQLLWSKRFGGVGYDRAVKVIVSGTDILIAGDTSSTSATPDVFITHADTASSITWTRTRDFGDSDYVTDLAPRYGLVGAITGGVLMAESTIVGKSNIVKLEYGLDAAFDSGAQLGNSFYPKRDGQVIRTLNLFTLEVNYYIGGTIDLNSGFGPWPFLAKCNSAGNAVFGNAYQTDTNPVIEGMDFDSTGINLCGWIPGGNSMMNALLLKFNSGTGEVLGAETWATASDSVRGNALLPYRNGLLIAGYAADNSGSWSTLNDSPTALSLSFTALSGTGTMPNWSANTATGVVTDITADGTLDTGGGADDGLLLYRPEL